MAGKPTLGEIARADHGIRMAKAYTAMLVENPDSVLQQRGRDMKIYDEILRDDRAKSCISNAGSLSLSPNGNLRNASFFGRLMGIFR